MVLLLAERSNDIPGRRSYNTTTTHQKRRKIKTNRSKEEKLIESEKQSYKHTDNRTETDYYEKTTRSRADNTGYQ